MYRFRGKNYVMEIWCGVKTVTHNFQSKEDTFIYIYIVGKIN